MTFVFKQAQTNFVEIKTLFCCTLYNKTLYVITESSNVAVIFDDPNLNFAFSNFDFLNPFFCLIDSCLWLDFFSGGTYLFLDFDDVPSDYGVDVRAIVLFAAFREPRLQSMVFSASVCCWNDVGYDVNRNVFDLDYSFWTGSPICCWNDVDYVLNRNLYDLYYCFWTEDPICCLNDVGSFLGFWIARNNIEQIMLLQVYFFFFRNVINIFPLGPSSKMHDLGMAAVFVLIEVKLNRKNKKFLKSDSIFRRNKKVVWKGIVSINQHFYWPNVLYFSPNFRFSDTSLHRITKH